MINIVQRHTIRQNCFHKLKCKSLTLVASKTEFCLVTHYSSVTESDGIEEVPIIPNVAQGGLPAEFKTQDQMEVIKGKQEFKDNYNYSPNQHVYAVAGTTWENSTVK